MKYYKDCPQPLDVCKHTAPLFEKLHAAQSREDYSQVIRRADEILAICHPCPHAAMDKAGALYRSEDYDACVQIADSLLAVGSYQSRMLLLKARIVARRDGNEAALETYRRADEADESDHDAHCELAAVLLHVNRPEESLPFAMRAREGRPTEDMAAATLCGVLAELGRKDDLLQEIDRMRDQDIEWDAPETAVVALALVEVDENELASSWFEKALSIDPQSVRDYCAQSRILFHNLERYEEAYSSFEKLAELDPEQHGRDAAMYISRIEGDVRGDWKAALETMIEARIRYQDDEEILEFLQRVIERTTSTAKEKEEETQLWRKRFEAMKHDHSSLRQAVFELRASSEPGLPLGIAIVEGEGQTVEFIELFPDNAHELAKEIAAFSTSNDGTIFLGVRDDDGEVLGLPDIEDRSGKDKLMNRIGGVASGSVTPAAQVSVSFIPHENKTVVRIFVPRGSEPVYYSSRVPYLRDVDSSRPALPHEVAELIRQRAPTSR